MLRASSGNPFKPVGGRKKSHPTDPDNVQCLSASQNSSSQVNLLARNGNSPSTVCPMSLSSATGLVASDSSSPGRNMSEPAVSDKEDKEQRKREYNRLAQRQFRRRRKEHLRTLEQLHNEQRSEQADEIEQLRHENAELQREIASLRARLFATGAGPAQASRSVPLAIDSSPAGYAMYPETSTYGHESPVAAEVMPSSSPYDRRVTMIPGRSQPIFAHSAAMAPQPLSATSDLYEHRASSSTQGISRSASDAALTAVTHDPAVAGMGPQQALQMPALDVEHFEMTEYDLRRAMRSIRDMFRPILTTSNTLSPETHLLTLSLLKDTLPPSLKPTPLQLQAPHYYGIDLIPSPSLRDKLIGTNADMARTFVDEVCSGFVSDRPIDGSLLTIWGDDPLNELAWEFSQMVLDRWGWLLGQEWMRRSNFWRHHREAASLPPGV